MITVDVCETGKNINKLRLDAGLSVKDIQQYLGFATPQAVYKWIHGTTLPSLDSLVILTSLFNVRMDDIIITHDENI